MSNHLKDLRGSEHHSSKDGFDAVYASSYAELVRLAYLLTRDREAACDVVQNAFVSAHRHWLNIGEPKAYLRRSVTNGCVTHHRANARDRRRKERLRTIAAVSAATTSDREYLADAIASLPGKQRQAIVLKFYLQLTTNEIADCMGIRPGSVGPTISRALKILERQVER